MKNNLDKESKPENKTLLTDEMEKIDVQKLLEQYDAESNVRKPIGLIAVIISIIAISMSAFQFYTGGFGLWLALKQRALHLAFTLALIFLLYPTTKKGIGSEKDRVPFFDIILSFIGAATCLYLIIYYKELVFRAGLPSTIDLVMGGITIILVLEATRRAIGPELPIVVIVFLLYAYFGPYMPGYFAHRGYSLERIIEHLYMQTEGIFGIPLGVSSSFVFLFILFGAVLNKTGMGKFFIDLSMALAGHTTGGPAKVAVIASGFMGSVSGSSVANVVTTGSFTIPLMKSVGYKKDFAGAVEAAASTGGQIMPPVMGAAAFVMSEMLEIPYIRIAAAAVIPAILYYAAVMMMVHLEACKNNLKGLPKNRLPQVRQVLREKGHLILPLLGLVYLLIKGYTPIFSAFWAIVLSFAASMVKKETRLDLKNFLGAFEDGAKGALGVASACACAGMVVGVTTLTGFGLKIASGIVALGGGKILPTLFFTMIASIILGMGLPTTAKYIILAIMAAPALIQLGVLPLAAHMFILYFGIIADLTPPVAVAAYAGAGIAGGNTMRTGFIAAKLALAGFLIPYVFAINPALMGVQGPILLTIRLVITSFAGVLALGAAASGFLLVKTEFYERIILFVIAIALIDPNIVTDLIGAAGLMVIIFLQYKKQKRQLQE